MHTMQTAFRELITYIVNVNGNGHKELKRQVTEGNITQEEAVIIDCYAIMERANTKLDTLLRKLEER